MVLYNNKLVDFTGWPAWTVYGVDQVTADFGNADTVQGGDRLKVDTTDRLRFYLPAGLLGSANTGGIIKAGIEPQDEYLVEYEIRFDGGFPWSKGGKVPGISGGAGYTGGDPAWPGDGFSVRMMWREDGRIIPYVYHYNQPDNFGDTFGETLGYFTNTRAHKVKYFVKLNTGANKDGILRIWLDDTRVLNKTDLTYRTDTSKIDMAHLAIFAGGSTEDWNMTGDGYIRLSYYKWEIPVYSTFSVTENVNPIPGFTTEATQTFTISPQEYYVKEYTSKIPQFIATTIQTYTEFIFSEFTAAENVSPIPVFVDTTTQTYTQRHLDFAATATRTINNFTISAVSKRKVNFLTFNQEATEEINNFAASTTAERLDPVPQTYTPTASDFIELTISANVEYIYFSPYEVEIQKPNTLWEPLPEDRAMVERNQTPRGRISQNNTTNRIREFLDILNNKEGRKK
jgi:hypothetical protein